MKAFRTVLLAILLLVPPAAAAVLPAVLPELLAPLWYPKRFAEVVPERLYRGGFPSPRHIRNLKKDLGIKTVISLTGYEDTPKYRDEKRTIAALGLRINRFPMPGNGCADFGDLDRAADALAEALADESASPVFFHCEAGKQRSNAVLAAYRLRQCGWTLSQAFAELVEHHGLDRESEGVLVDHLSAYADWLEASGHRSRTGSE